MNFQQRNQQVFEYHAVDNLEVRVENRSAGCWSSSSIKLVQLCCFGTLFPIIWILIPVYVKEFLSYSSSALPLAFTSMYMLDPEFSTVWCKGHVLHTNFTIDAYLVNADLPHTFQPQNWTYQYELGDDTKEYWGYYLLKGSQLSVKTCARHFGATVTLIRTNTSSELLSCLRRNTVSEENPGTSSHPNRKEKTSHERIARRINLLAYTDSNQTMLENDVDEMENGAFEDLVEENDESKNPKDNDSSLSEEMSTSSSEEDLLACVNLIATKPVFPDENCTEGKLGSRHTLIEYTVLEEGYHFVVFSSNFEEKEDERNSVSAQFNLLKIVFNTTNSVAACHNTTECLFNLHFASSQRVVVALPAANQSISEPDFNYAYSVDSECLPRTPIYLAFGLTLPLVLIVCAFL